MENAHEHMRPPGDHGGHDDRLTRKRCKYRGSLDLRVLQRALSAIGA